MHQVSADSAGETIDLEIPGSSSRHFQQIKSLTLFVTSSHGADLTCIGWLGLKGARTHMKLKGVLENTDYEVRVCACVHMYARIHVTSKGMLKMCGHACVPCVCVCGMTRSGR